MPLPLRRGSPTSPQDFSGVVPAFFGQGQREKLVAMDRDWLESPKIETKKIARRELARS